MSNELPQPKQSEEVDLGQLFKLIGNAFQRFFNFIGNILYQLFLAFVWMVFFVKKHILKLVIAGILGIVLGFVIEKRSDPVYKSYITVKQNYLTGENLYNLIDYYNDLIKQEDTETLAAVMDIDTMRANSILSFDVEAVMTENDRIRSFDHYLKELDSTLASTIEYETYISNLEEYNQTIQQITIKSKRRNSFTPVFNKIIERVITTDYFKNEQKKDTIQILNRKNALLNALIKSDSLKNTYKRVLEMKANEEGGAQTSVTIKNSDEISKTKEFELYQNDIVIERELVELERQKEDKKYILEIISSKQEVGTAVSGMKFFNKFISAKIYYAFIFVILTFLVLCGLQAIKFLERFK